MQRTLLFALAVLFTTVSCGGTSTPTSPNPSSSSGSSSTGGGTTNPNPGSNTRGSVSARIDGVAWSSTVGVTATYANGIVAIGASDTGTTLGIGTTASGPGTYAVGPLSATNANLYMVVQGSSRGWAANLTGGSGSITFSTLTATSASGTFSFNLVPVPGSGATGTKVVTDGFFNVTF